jgi:hypothetical protein
MKTLEQIQERIKQIDQEIYDVRLGARLAMTQEIAFKVAKEVEPMLNLLTNKRNILDNYRIQLTRN